MKKFMLSFTVIFTFLLFLGDTATAQQYKLRQVNNMMGMKSESTIYVKGMRKRTEGGGMMGIGADIATIQQCDLQRTVKLNDKKKLYFIEPFSTAGEEVIDEEATPVPKNKAILPPKKDIDMPNTQKGGVITMWYNITDTGERKNMHGFNARHVWTMQKMKPSPDACTMKDSMEMRTDGWYIDLPQFNCPVQYRPSRPMRPPGARPNGKPDENEKPGCMDRFVTHRSGKGKLGFPISETTTIKMGGGNAQNREMVTSRETLDFSTAELDSMLFEIPPGYQEAKTEDELQDKMDVNSMLKDMMNKAKENNVPAVVNGDKKTGMIRIGVYAPTGDDQVQGNQLQQHMVGTLNGGKVEAVAVASEEDARKLNCDYTLGTNFTKIKSGNKLGGILKAIKNADPNAASSFTIQAGLVLKALADGSVRTQQKVDGKYEGKIDDAAGKALDDGCREVLKALN
jgi:hypothetical protein